MTDIPAYNEKEISIKGHLFYVIRAIDGARTRGLDLGKVARYQLRHYRIRYVCVLSRVEHVLYNTR